MAVLKRARDLLPHQLGWKFGVFVLCLTLASLAIGTKAFRDVNSLTRCQATYIAKNSEVQQLRAGANEAKDRAVSGLLDGVSDIVLADPLDDSKAEAERQTQNRETYLRLFEEYQRASVHLTAERKRSPLPSFPQECKPAE